ncbi:hypothetical protein CCACVL1_05216 [Corchorus capsularis]|uniref:Uncharacterized protein n=1 Tax=Corchorus capsularis TaxID=210143 RepID=A0A1R3JM16_COCAP|nr:hypothetical protein CCACVL1_05216 [Corchorus capsularis]
MPHDGLTGQRGGILLTNGKLVENNNNDVAKTSAIGAMRNKEGLMNKDEMLFQVQIEMHRILNEAYEEERNYQFNCQWDRGPDTKHNENESHGSQKSSPKTKRSPEDEEEQENNSGGMIRRRLQRQDMNGDEASREVEPIEDAEGLWKTVLEQFRNES